MMKIWREVDGALENNGIRIMFDNIEQNHYYTVFFKGDIVATLRKSDHIIIIDGVIPKMYDKDCDCDHCERVKNGCDIDA